MTEITSDLSRNLRFLCTERRSIAQVCRDIGINQQQFSKYLTGRARPSPHNLRRIAQYFELAEADLEQEHGVFIEHFLGRPGARSKGRPEPLQQAFPGDLRLLRAFLGAYQVYYLSPAAPGKIVVAATFLDEVDGLVFSRTIEAHYISAEARRQWIRCDGKAALHGERIFITEFEPNNGGSFTTTTLVPPHRYRHGTIFGMMFFLASHPRRMPCASRTVWKRAPANLSAKDILRRCGTYNNNSTQIDPVIRKYLSDTTPGLPITPPLDH